MHMKNNTIRSRNPKGQFTTAPHKRVAAQAVQSAKRKPARLKESGPTSNPDGSIVEGPQN
jgi:hypothetical protein